MTTLKKYQAIEDEHSKLKRENQTGFPPHPRGESNSEVRSQQGLESAREIVAGDMKKAIVLLKKKLEVKHALDSLGPRHGYVDIHTECSGCGCSFTETHNLYMEYDFKKALCPECKSRNENLEQVKIIEEGENLKPVYNNIGELIEVTFESGGVVFVVKTEDDEGDGHPLTVEKE